MEIGRGRNANMVTHVLALTLVLQFGIHWDFFFYARKIVWSDACSPMLQIHTWFNVEGKEEVC